MTKPRTLLLLACFTVLAIAVTGCGGGSPSPLDTTNPGDRDGTRQWTVMVYMAADNNLEPYAIQDMNELESVGSTDQVSVVVQFDRSSGYDVSNGNWTGSRRFYITRDSDVNTIHSQMLQDLGTVDMANPQNLSDFVQWAAQNYPAQHYLLVLWDHGRGWRTRGLEITAQRDVRSIFIDDSNRTEMSLPSLKQALEQAPKTDIVLFDACLMQMLEVAYSIKDCADIMVASEENVPVLGQPYGRVLSDITSNPGISSASLSRSIVDEYMNYYITGFSGTFTLSAIDLSNLDQTATATDRLASAVLDNMDTVKSQVESAQAETQHFDYDKGEYRHYKDLYDFAKLVSTKISVPEVRSAAQDVMTSLDDTILYSRNSSGEMANAHGLSVYLPDPGYVLSQYYTLDYSQATKWDEMVANY